MLCVFGRRQLESREHLFFECSFARRIWLCIMIFLLYLILWSVLNLLCGNIAHSSKKEANGSKGLLNHLLSRLGLDISLPTDKGSRIKVQFFIQLGTVGECYLIKCYMQLLFKNYKFPWLLIQRLNFLTLCCT